MQWSRTKKWHIMHDGESNVTLPAGSQEHFSCALHICPHLLSYFNAISVQTNARAQW